jgi:hypothetical protein
MYFLRFHEALDDLVDFRVDERLAAGDADHGRAAFLDRGEALLRGQALVEDVIRVLDLAAAGAGQVAAEEGFKHQHERIALAALELLGDDVGGDRPSLRDGNHSFVGNRLNRLPYGQQESCQGWFRGLADPG